LAAWIRHASRARISFRGEDSGERESNAWLHTLGTGIVAGNC
jgi:hypothetical protein